MKKKEKNKAKDYYLVVLMVLALCIAVAFWYFEGKTNNIASNSGLENIKKPRIDYSHPTMDFSITYAPGFEVEEKNHQVTFFKGENKVLISSSSTNYPNLTSHLSDPRNDLLARASEVEKLTINGYEAMSGVLDGKKYFFIYVDNAVYFLSTSSPDLYDELDAIAQSFHYLGN